MRMVSRIAAGIVVAGDMRLALDGVQCLLAVTIGVNSLKCKNNFFN
jgi:hypothetical protein